MPRHGSLLSDSESSEPVFHFEPSLSPISTTPSTSGLLQPSATEPPRRIFSHAREAIAKSKKREVHVESDNDPFAFTAEDEAPEPVRKKPRRGCPRGTQGKEIRSRKEVQEDGGTKTRGASTCRIVEDPSLSSDQSVEDRKEEEETSKPTSLQEGLFGKRGRQESGESSESEASVDRSKRARKEEEEPKKYQQITHMRTITTLPLCHQCRPSKLVEI